MKIKTKNKTNDDDDEKDDDNDQENKIAAFNYELYLLNKKFHFLMEMEKNNFFEVNHFIMKYSLGLGWWLIIILIAGDAVNILPWSINFFNWLRK